MIIHLAVALLWLGAVTGWSLIIRDRFRSLKPPALISEALDDYPRVTIIVPARNEESNIEVCLNGLLSQDYPQEKLFIIVVNDHSEDETAAVARRLSGSHNRFKVIDAPTLPEGWRGKQHACWYGAQQAEGEWLCFIDADTRHSRDLLTTTITDAEFNKLDLLSLHPEQEMQGFWERLLMPVPFMSLMLLLDAHQINDPNSQAAMANGQFILIRSEVYFAVEGHNRIRTAVLEDVELGKLVKRSGWKIAIRSGTELIRTRMYSDLSTLWEALARNGSELFGPALTAFAVLNAFFAAIFPLGYPLWLSARITNNFSWTGASAFAAATIGTLQWYATHMIAFQELNVPRRYLLLLPLSDLLVGLVNLDGIVRRLRGRRTWKGRAI
jgi:chlorobactene glucosyltransferase